MTMQREDNSGRVVPTTSLPSIPAKRYFTIGEVSDLCGVKAHVLRYWEQEFTQLKSITRRGNRRYYQHHEVLLIRRIRELLYEHGFTIHGARNRLDQEKRDVSAAPSERTALPPLIDREKLKEQLLTLRSEIATANGSR
jgi:DNA-binding transcriptional MerR regulator